MGFRIGVKRACVEWERALNLTVGPHLFVSEGLDMPGRIGLALFLAAALLGWSPSLQAAGYAPGPQCKANGPCRLPDTVDVLLRAGAPDAVVASNFGLLLPSTSGPGYQFVCEEVFGGKIGDRSKVAPDGRVYVPALDGLYSSDDGCSWTRAKGALEGVPIWDVAFDPGTPGKVWVLGADPRLLGLSTDGGLNVTTAQSFPEGERFVRVVPAPSDPNTIYLGGYRGKVPLILGVSTDGGQHFAIDDNASEGMADANQVVDLLAVSPADPKTVYFLATSQTGDQLWKSTDKGKAPVKILTLGEEGELYGFTFGADDSTLYVGSRDPLMTAGKPPAYLYFSHDAGKTWDRRPSTDKGPRFRCLRYRDGKLFACGGDQNNGDSFLLGSSTDEGKTWTPVVTLADLQGARSCVLDKCLATASWLCESYGVCGGLNREAGTPPKRDGGTVVEVPPKKGCAYGDGEPSASMVILLAALLALARRRSREVG
jgi:photosystem II stability/assembly factor-like uncharacterized protein